MFFNFPTDFHHILPSLEGKKTPLPLEFQFSFTYNNPISTLSFSPLPPFLRFANGHRGWARGQKYENLISLSGI